MHGVRRPSSVENCCCCAIRLIGIILLIAAFFYLHQLQSQILHQLEANEEDALNNLARIHRIEGLLKTIPEPPGQHEDEGNRVEDCKTEVLNAVKLYYSEDETGRADYALESAGGRILGVYDTENLVQPRTLSWIFTCDGPHGPRELINPGMMPGQCWAFKGSRGTVVIRLTEKIRITSVSIQHVSKAISHVNDLKSAPRDFSVWGLTSEPDAEENLGSFVYDAEGPSLQVFKVSCAKAHDRIKFSVTSNHGNPRFTCVYRLRVHGIRACDK